MNQSTIKSQITIQELANAYKTYLCCSGHHKADMNERRVKEYTDDLLKRGITVPSEKELGELGVFNGQGSY